MTRIDPVQIPSREPILRAPLVVVLLALSMPLFYLVQQRLPDQGMGGALYPVLLRHGEWGGLLTSMLLHLNWAHVAANAVGALAFGAPVARLMKGPAGAAAFLGLYIAGGVLAGLAYALAHMSSAGGAAGASGGVFVLIGAATRLLHGGGRVRPMRDPQVLGMAAAWMAANLVFGLIGFAPGMDGAGVAWEAHAGGFVVGFLAIGPLGRLFRESRFASRPDLSDPEA